MSGDSNKGLRIKGFITPGERMNGWRTRGDNITGLPTNGVRISGERTRGDKIRGIKTQGLRIIGPNAAGESIIGLRTNGERTIVCETVAGFKIRFALSNGDKATVRFDRFLCLSTKTFSLFDKRTISLIISFSRISSSLRFANLTRTSGLEYGEFGP